MHIVVVEYPTLLSFIPARCWIAPEIPTAMYSSCEQSNRVQGYTTFLHSAIFPHTSFNKKLNIQEVSKHFRLNCNGIGILHYEYRVVYFSISIICNITHLSSTKQVSLIPVKILTTFTLTAINLNISLINPSNRIMVLSSSLFITLTVMNRFRTELI